MDVLGGRTVKRPSDIVPTNLQIVAVVGAMFAGDPWFRGQMY